MIVPISFKSDYSLLKSLLKIENIIEYAKNNDATFVGILDDNPYGIMDFYDKCSKNNIKCIFGMIVKIGTEKIYLYVRNYVGYQNLIKINSLISKKKLNLNLILQYKEGLIVVVPYSSYVLYNRLKNDTDIYIGYSNDVELSKARGLTKKVVYIYEIMAFTKNDINILKLLYKINDDEYKERNNYLLPMSDFDKENLFEFQKKIDLRFDFNKKYIPIFCKNEDESKKFLYKLSFNGLSKRLGGIKNDIYYNRLKKELDIIYKMGFVDYFLIVYDYVKFAKKSDILVGPGRGSAAGSLVSYSLGITDIDPIKYNLLFERFLNPERVTMPDIDVDFEDVRRKDIIEYVKSRYGEKKVSLIVAYSTFGSRQAFRDSAKILGTDEIIINTLSKKIEPKKTLKQNLKNQELINYIKDNNLESVYKVAMRIEGIKRHTTIHAAGVIISSINLNELIPVMSSGDNLLAGFTMEYLERLGLLKMDFLALSNLTAIHNILKLIAKDDPNFDIKKIPLNDSKTFKLFEEANTDNVFQFESDGMKNFLKKLKPTKFEDLVAANALFRPGPMQNIDEYIKRKNNPSSIKYLHKDLEPILSETYGIIVYQEQIMQILAVMGGYTYAEADLIRRAMSKKKHDVMISDKEKFVLNAQKRGYTKELAEEVYNLILKFSDYGFNKSHSVAYALIGYETAYLKANYKDLCELNTLNTKIDENNIKKIITDAKTRGIKIVKPDINTSKYAYVIENKSLILPLTAIKNINSSSSKLIIDNAPYSDFFDFYRKCYNKGINDQLIKTLINAGAFDSLGFSHSTLISNMDSASTYVKLCDNLDESIITRPEIIISDVPDDEVSDLDIYGFYLFGHPASKFESKTKLNMLKTAGKAVRLYVLVENYKVINTKNNDKMAFVQISDETGKIDAVLFPNHVNYLELIKEDTVVLLTGVTQIRNNKVQLIINKVEQTKNT